MNRDENEPRLAKPTSMQTSVTVRFAPAEQVLRPVDAAPGQVPDGRLAIGSLETAGEMELGHHGHTGQLRQVQGLGVVAVDVVPGPAELRQQPEGSRWSSRRPRHVHEPTGPRSLVG